MEISAGNHPQPNILMLNARAIMFMANGLYAEAIELLETALREIAGQLLTTESQQQQRQQQQQQPTSTPLYAITSSSNGSAEMGSSGSIHYQMIPIHKDHESSLAEGPSWYQGNGVVIYDRPCLVQVCFALDTNKRVPTAVAKQSAVPILFNYGLALHLWAVRGATDQARMLAMALHVYSQTLDKLAKHGGPSSSSSNCHDDERDRVLFAMIMQNNILCIYSELFRMDSASRCLQELVKVLKVALQYRTTFEHAFGRCQLNAWFWASVRTRCAPVA